MGLLDQSTRISLGAATSTTMNATGATSLVSAPGAGKAIAVTRLQVYIQTNTTGLVETSWRSGGTGQLLFQSTGISLGSSPITLDLMSDPWVLDANTALQAVCSVTAVSTPSIVVSAAFKVVNV